MFMLTSSDGASNTSSLTTLIPFTYAVLTFRRLLRYDEYVQTGGVNGGENDYEMGNKVHIFASGSPTSASKRASYLSEDTSYASRTSGSTFLPLKIHVDRAVETEIGWRSGIPPTGKVQRSGSLVGMGTVQGRKSAALESFETVRRDSERGFVDVDDGLGSEEDYEEDDEEDDGDTVRGSHDGGRQTGVGQQAVSEDDTRALLASHGRERGS